MHCGPGASGYVLKSMPQDELLAVIRAVHAGKRQVPAEVAALLAEHLGEEDLTPRELEVLQLIRDGYKNKQIADRLSISENTVNFHIKNIVDKLARKRSDACGDDCGPPRAAAALIDSGDLQKTIVPLLEDLMGLESVL